MLLSVMIEGQEGVTWPHWTGARADGRAPRLHRPLPLRPLSLRRRQARPRRARRVGDDLRARAADGADQAWHDRQARPRSATRRCWRSWSRPPTTPPEAAPSSALGPAGGSPSTTATASPTCRSESASTCSRSRSRSSSASGRTRPSRSTARTTGSTSSTRSRRRSRGRGRCCASAARASRAGCGSPRRWADEYNTVHVSPETCREIRDALDDACVAAGRDPADGAADADERLHRRPRPRRSWLGRAARIYDHLGRDVDVVEQALEEESEAVACRHARRDRRARIGSTATPGSPTSCSSTTCSRTTTRWR